MVTMASRTGRQLQRYNNQGCRQVVGCIPFRFRKLNQSPSIRGILTEELEVLLISSQKSTRLMFPKGGWELDESIEEAASRECIEEAGIDGIIGCKLGKWSFKSKSQSKFHEGHMFPLLVTKELDVWPEQNLRQRVWMSVKESREMCAHGWMIEALEKLVQRLIVPLQRKEEEKRACCSFEYFKSEELRISGSLSQAIVYLANELPHHIVYFAELLSELVSICYICKMDPYLLKLVARWREDRAKGLLLATMYTPSGQACVLLMALPFTPPNGVVLDSICYILLVCGGLFLLWVWYI